MVQKKYRSPLTKYTFAVTIKKRYLTRGRGKRVRKDSIARSQIYRSPITLLTEKIGLKIEIKT
ncbi:hypothetical protein [Floridanema evergladense]|uniref:Ribosomal protein L34 n=1 Tax=Floridaenema evergladense BLCC-F167 TaxID=3153639 RepID=A0ABV4WMN7_9CYAN